MRFFLASILILLGGLLAFPGSLALWEQRTIVDENSFVSLGQDVLKQPQVQKELAVDLGDQVRALVNANTSTPPPRPILDALTLAAIKRLAGGPVAEKTLRDTHRLVVAIANLQNNDGRPVQRDQDAIVLDLRPVVEELLGDTALLDPSLRSRIVVPADTGRIVIVRSKEIQTAIDAMHTLDRGAKLLMVLPLIAFALALLVAPSRGVALIAIGGVIAGGAGLRIFLLHGPLASVMRDVLAETTTAQGAGLATYDTLVDSFVKQDMTVLIVGGAVAGAGLLLAILLHRSY